MFSILLSVFLFILGFFILIKGADFVIRGATSIARFLGVSEWLVGVVIVGIGTSLPELAINITSAWQGTPVGVGTILGSNIFNMLGIMGIIAFVAPVTLRPEWIKRDLLINIGAVIASGAVLFLSVTGSDFMGITRLEALFLFILFITWMRFMAIRKDDDVIHPHHEQADIAAWHISALLIVAGLVGVFLGSDWIISGAEKIARHAGVSESLIGLTIVALGTSVPEIAVSLSAIVKRNISIAVGNILGSNIFDLLGIFGIAGMIVPIKVLDIFVFDYLYLLTTAILIFTFMFVGKHYTVSRTQGLFIFLLYLAYILVITLRG